MATSSPHTSNYERDGRPFYLEEVKIREPSSDIKFEKVIVESPVKNITRLTAEEKLNDEYIRDNESEAPTEQLNDTIDALRASSGNLQKRPHNQNQSQAQHQSPETSRDSDSESVDSSSSRFGENPCVIEDFVRNFLLRSNMFRTLEVFQSEWFENYNTESTEIGLTASVSTQLVPDVYAKNELLNDKVINYAKDNEKLQAELNRLKEDYGKLAKERDFHRMHHRRIIQEKDKLLNDIKRQTIHYKNYEPTLKDLRRKYESAMKEKMLSNLERDRALAHLNTIIGSEIHPVFVFL